MHTEELHNLYTWKASHMLN